MTVKRKNNDNEAVVIGAGVVGKATSYGLGITKFCDKEKSRSNVTFDSLVKFKYLFLCVPTPTNSKGCDTSIVESIIRAVGNKPIYIIRSTVAPGTAERLMKKYNCLIISNPEFLTEKTALEDAKKPDIIVVGSKDKKLLASFKRRFYPDKKIKGSRIFLTDNQTAETIKYAINTFYATKVIFANFLYQVCCKAKVDYPTVKEVMYQRKWIGANHLTVPYQGKFGVQGKCLPKDLRAFACYSGHPFFKQMVKFMEEINQWEAKA